MTDEQDDTTQVLSGLDAVIEMHPHATGEREFYCFCGAYHLWGERGTRTFVIPHNDRWTASGWQMIECGCKVWHMKAIERQDAENKIAEEKDK